MWFIGSFFHVLRILQGWKRAKKDGEKHWSIPAKCVFLFLTSPRGTLSSLVISVPTYLTLRLLSPNLSQQWLVRAVRLEFLKQNRTYGLSLRKWEITVIETGLRMFSLIRKEKQILCKFCYSEQKQIIWSHPKMTPEKAMASHSSTLAWKIPWMEEPGRLQSMGSLGVGHDWATSLSLFTFMHWRRKWQPTPVFLPGESQGQGSLVGCRLWGRTELDTTEVT